MSYANMDGVPTQTAGTSEILASDWNTYVRDNFDSIKFGHIVVADATARNALSVAEGTMVYQSDVNYVYVYDGSNWILVNNVNNVAYQYVTTVYFTSGGTFSKGSYPYLRAIRVKCVGGGGGSGGCGNNANAGSGGGGGGAYAESFITDIAGLSSSVTVTVGAGGAGGASGSNAGSAGGDSSFGSSVIAKGGSGSVGSGAGGSGGDGGSGSSSTGDFKVGGGGGFAGGGTTESFLGVGGAAALGYGPSHRHFASYNASTGPSAVGFLYGGGGAGTAGQNSNRAGAAGGAGIVIVELYA